MTVHVQVVEGELAHGSPVVTEAVRKAGLTKRAGVTRSAIPEFIPHWTGPRIFWPTVMTSARSRSYSVIVMSGRR